MGYRPGRLYDTEEAAGERGSIYVTGMLKRFPYKFDLSLIENQIIKGRELCKVTWFFPVVGVHQNLARFREKMFAL